MFSIIKTLILLYHKCERGDMQIGTVFENYLLEYVPLVFLYKSGLALFVHMYKFIPILPLLTIRKYLHDIIVGNGRMTLQ